MEKIKRRHGGCIEPTYNYKCIMNLLKKKIKKKKKKKRGAYRFKEGHVRRRLPISSRPVRGIEVPETQKTPKK